MKDKMHYLHRISSIISKYVDVQFPNWNVHIFRGSAPIRLLEIKFEFFSNLGIGKKNTHKFSQSNNRSIHELCNMRWTIICIIVEYMLWKRLYIHIQWSHYKPEHHNWTSQFISSSSRSKWNIFPSAVPSTTFVHKFNVIFVCNRCCSTKIDEFSFQSRLNKLKIATQKQNIMILAGRTS